MKKLVKSTENELHKIVKESVNKILNEDEWNDSLEKAKEWEKNRYPRRVNDKFVEMSDGSYLADTELSPSNNNYVEESRLNRIVKESVKSVLKEDYDNNPLYSNYYHMIDACGSIIFRTSTNGRRFDDRELGGLADDPKFMELRQEVLENMEGYFNAAKFLLAYISKRCRNDGETSLAAQADKWLNKEFTPTW